MAAPQEKPAVLDHNKYFGTFYIPGERDNFFMDLPLEERVLVLAMLDACPEPQNMIETFAHQWIINRYKECNYVSGLIVEKAKELNKHVANQMLAKKPRLPGEVPQGYEPEAVPDDYEEYLYPGAQAVGYAASRVLIEQFGRQEPWQIGDERVKKGFYLLESALKVSRDPIEFLVVLAQFVTLADAEPKAVLGHLLAIELKGEGIYTQIKQIGRKMRSSAPELWECYCELTPQERAEAGMLPIELVE
jgi:hypothetical protein